MYPSNSFLFVYILFKILIRILQNIESKVVKRVHFQTFVSGLEYARSFIELCMLCPKRQESELPSSFRSVYFT